MEPEKPIATTDVERLIELARTRAGNPGDWSLVTDTGWVERCYCQRGATTRLWEQAGGLVAAASVSAPQVRTPGRSVITVASMIAPGAEHLWVEQRRWIEGALLSANRGADCMVQVVSEALSDDEVRRWVAAGYRLVFEELAMERELKPEPDRASPRWPADAEVIDWGPRAAAAAYTVYISAFCDRPGFPGWSEAEWTDRLTGGDDFLAEASLAVLVQGIPAGYVVSGEGWIAQVGVLPEHRRMGLASALVTEAVLRMRSLGVRTVRLHVNVNNPGALATWRALGWRVVGRRGRFERGAVPR